MQTTWQLRKRFGLYTPNHKDSYKPVERIQKIFAPMIVPKKLEENLPFKTKDKIKKLSQKEKLQKEERSLLKPLATDDEKKAIYLVQRLKLIEKEKKKKDQAEYQTSKALKEKWNAGMMKDRTNAVKKLRKEKFIKQGIAAKNKRQQ
jgi:ribosome biogenesis protein BMS1